MNKPKVRRPFGELPYKDLPGVAEVYADGLGSTIFNARTAHITLTVNRFAPPHPPRALNGEHLTAARLALDSDAVIDLFNELTRMMRMLEEHGLIRLNEGIAQRPN